MLELPVIDLSLSDGSTRGDLCQTLYQALSSTGFFYLTGIPEYSADELFSLTKWFFSLPNEVKFSITKKMFNQKATHIYRGYFPIQPEEISHKEGFEIGLPTRNTRCEASSREQKILEELNQWPISDNNKADQQFKESMTHYYKILNAAGIEIMSLIAEIWGMDSNSFTPLFTPNSLSTFRLLHYPPRDGVPPEKAIDGADVLQCDEHKDSGFLTLLSTFGYEGLQIRGPDQKWLDAPVREGCLVVNIGKLLETISGGVLKATNHRVIDKGETRYSSPFFLEPRFDANVNIRLPKHAHLDEIGEESEKPTLREGEKEEKYGLWLISRMQKFAEFRGVLD